MRKIFTFSFLMLLTQAGLFCQEYQHAAGGLIGAAIGLAYCGFFTADFMVLRYLIAGCRISYC